MGEEVRPTDALAWDAADADRVLEATAEHCCAVAFRLGALFDLRRSEVLALRWDDVDLEAKSLRIDESLVATNEGAAWCNAKNERSRRMIPSTTKHGRRLLVGRPNSCWHSDQPLISLC